MKKLEILKASRPLVFKGAIVETDEACAKLFISLGYARLYKEPEEAKEEKAAPKKKTTKKKSEE